jgi:hypothetical protein
MMLSTPIAVTSPGRPCDGGAEEYCNGVTGIGAAIGVAGVVGGISSGTNPPC